jgi:hypothetical protein
MVAALAMNCHTPLNGLKAYGQYGEDSGGECGIPYARRFQMPAGTSSTTNTARANSNRITAGTISSGSSSNSSAGRISGLNDASSLPIPAAAATAAAGSGGSGAAPYYSLDVGVVHIVAISVEVDFTNSSIQGIGDFDTGVENMVFTKTPRFSNTKVLKVSGQHGGTGHVFHNGLSKSGTFPSTGRRTQLIKEDKRAWCGEA